MSFKLPNLDSSKQSSTINLQSARETARTNLLNFTLTYDGGKKSIEGLLKNKPKFSLEGDYDRLINFDEKFSALNKLGGAVFGAQLGLTKTWSKRIYKGGSYLGISLQTRIMDDLDEFGKLKRSVKYKTSNLISLCNPDSLSDVSDKDIKKLASLANTAKDQGSLDRVTGLVKGLGSGLAGSTPPEVSLRISNYFKLPGFFVKAVSFDFSHEQTKNGPLYSDVEVELIQSQILPAWEIKKGFYQNVTGKTKTVGLRKEEPYRGSPIV